MGLLRVRHDWATSLHALEKEMATHSSVLAWRIPGMTEPAGLPSMGSQSQTRLKRLSSSSSRLLDRGWDGWMASQTQWTWVWASSGVGEDKEVWCAAVHGIPKSQTLLSNWTELKLQNFLFSVRVGYIKDCQLTLIKQYYMEIYTSRCLFINLS